MRTGGFQRRQQALLVMYTPCPTAVAFRVFGKINLHQRPIQSPGLRVTVTIFRAETPHPVPHLQVVNTPEAGVIKQQDSDFYPLLNGGL